ncbi:GGDEF domain-containing protein [bacterium]|nr:MAG: GGDEF domain-containing protein [bacterium]
MRSGGEEFSALLQTQSPLGALEVGERIRANLARTLVTYNGRQIRITGSIGIAHRSVKDSCGVRELVQRADQALYEAKRQGKNRVCVYQGESLAGTEQVDGKPETPGSKVVRLK